MTFESIVKDIKNKKYAPIYLLHGEESYYIDKISSLIEGSVLSEGEKAFNQAVLYGKDADFKMIVDEARQFPMMSPYRVVILKEAKDMRSLKNLESYAANPSPQTILVINHKHKTFDSRTKLAKAIKANGVIFQSKKIYDNKVQGWINSYLRERGFDISPEASHIAAEYLGADLTKIANEMDKVVVNVKDDNKVTADLVKEMIGISKDYNVFELQKAISQRDSEKIFRIVNYFGANEKSNPLTLILSSLFNYFYKVYVALYHAKSSDSELQKLLGLHSTFFVKEYRMAARNFNGSKIINAFESLKEADLTSKGVGARNKSDHEVLRDLMISIMHHN